MDAPRNPHIQKLMEMVEGYFSNNEKDSKFAEAGLLETTLSGEELIYILDELDLKRKNDLWDKNFHMEEFRKEYQELSIAYENLSYDYNSLEKFVKKYRPLVDTIVSIIEETTKKEAGRILDGKEPKDDDSSDDLPF